MISLNKTEQEVIVLKAVWDMIDDMVNFAMLEWFEPQADLVLTFKTAEHFRLFSLLLVDFLSPPKLADFGIEGPPSEALPIDQTYLYYLRKLSANPQLRPGNSSLTEKVNLFSDWLSETTTIPGVYLPSIQVELDMTITRLRFIKMCGNISKHNIFHLSKHIMNLRLTLSDNGVAIDHEDAVIALPDFYDWFHENIFLYHASTIAEHLSNLRWEIFDYLSVEFSRFDRGSSPGVINPDISHKIAQSMYCDLMGKVRRGPFVPRFEISQYAKLRF